MDAEVGNPGSVGKCQVVGQVSARLERGHHPLTHSHWSNQVGVFL